MTSQKKDRFGYAYDSAGAPVELGRGASGVTYQGWIRFADGSEEETKAALKHFSHLVAPDTKTERSHEGRREFLQFGGLRHRNVVEYLRFFYDNHRPIIATRFIDGKNLHVLASQASDLRDNQSREWIRRVLRWGHEISDALTYLSGCPVPVVHRDIKPSNIVIRAEDDKAVLIDFGIGKLNIERRTHASTLGHGTFLGTPQFAAPEQFMISPESCATWVPVHVSGKTDVYSLAVTLAFALVPACVPNDEGRPAHEVMARLPRFEMLPNIPALKKLLKEMTAPSPEARPSAHDVRDQLGKIMWKEFGDPPPAGDSEAIPPPPHAAELPEFVSLGHGIEIARNPLSQHTALYYSERHYDSLEPEAASRVARRSYGETLALIENINREYVKCGDSYRLPTVDEWRLGSGRPQEGLLAANEVQCIFDSESEEMEWLEKSVGCSFPECRRVAYLYHGEPQDTERHQSWPKGVIRLIRESNISS